MEIGASLDTHQDFVHISAIFSHELFVPSERRVPGFDFDSIGSRFRPDGDDDPSAAADGGPERHGPSAVSEQAIRYGGRPGFESGRVVEQGRGELCGVGPTYFCDEPPA
mgnify:CR=1 FL=1